YIYPTLIAPLFDRFEPLPEGGVRDRVEQLLARCGFASKGLFVMDGSKRSAHGNAYFTGFGRAKRIVFFDTLLERLDATEIEAVLAHELGHFRHRHILRRIAVSFALSAAGLWLLAWVSRQPWFYQGLGLTPEPGMLEPAALVLFFIALPVFTFPLGPLMSLMSRRDEFQADAFAASHADGNALVAALVKLYQDNASTLTPDPVHSIFYDSHPPAAARHGRPGAQPSSAAMEARPSRRNRRAPRRWAPNPAGSAMSRSTRARSPRCWACSPAGPRPTARSGASSASATSTTPWR